MITVAGDDLIVIRPAGRITWGTLQRLYSSVLEIERDHPLHKRLVLTDLVETVHITAHDIVLHKMSRPDPPLTVQTAFVVSSDFQYGMGRMFQSLLETEKNRISIFRCLEDACHWLNTDITLVTKPEQNFFTAGVCESSRCV